MFIEEAICVFGATMLRIVMQIGQFRFDFLDTAALRIVQVEPQQQGTRYETSQTLLSSFAARRSERDAVRGIRSRRDEQRRRRRNR